MKNVSIEKKNSFHAASLFSLWCEAKKWLPKISQLLTKCLSVLGHFLTARTITKKVEKN